jgi:uncharacterized protein YukE
LNRHSAHTLGLIQESHQAMHQHLSELARECQDAAAAHGESLRTIHAAIQDLRRAHEQIVTRLNHTEKLGQ